MQWKYGLDVLRAWAILFVMLFHWPFPNAPKIFIFFHKSLACGVDLFFVLSGFLIASQWFHSISKKEKKKIFKKFYIKRLFRIIPLYMIFLLIEGLRANLLTQTDFNLFSYLTLTQNFFGISIFPVSWSLCIEEHFYLCFPIFSWIILKNGNHRLFKTILLILIFYPMFLRAFVFLPYLDGHSLIDPIILPKDVSGLKGNTFFRIEALSCGVFLAYLKHYYSGIWEGLTKKHITFDSLGIIITLLGFICGNYYNSLLRFSVSPIFFALGFSCFIISSFNEKSILNLVKLNFFSFTAKLAYPLYLSHFSAWMLLAVISKRYDLKIPSVLEFFIGFSIAFLLAWLLNIFVEERFLKKRKVVISNM